MQCCMLNFSITVILSESYFHPRTRGGSIDGPRCTERLVGGGRLIGPGEKASAAASVTAAAAAAPVAVVHGEERRNQQSELSELAVVASDRLGRMRQTASAAERISESQSSFSLLLRTRSARQVHRKGKRSQKDGTGIAVKFFPHSQKMAEDFGLPP